MQSANVPGMIDEACFHLDAIVDIIDEDDMPEELKTAIVNLQAASESPENTDYIQRAMEDIVVLCSTFNPEGPYYSYAQDAKTTLNKVQSLN